jgi:hypothetical protein
MVGIAVLAVLLWLATYHLVAFLALLFGGIHLGTLLVTRTPKSTPRSRGD